MKSSRKSKYLRNTIIQTVLLLIFWLLLSGHYDLMHVSFGIFSVALVMLIHYPLRRRLFALEEERSASLSFSRLLRLSFYIPWLIIQIVVSSLQVARCVLHPRCPFDPSLLRFKTKLKNVSSRVVLANSITLTPGTITLEISNLNRLPVALYPGMRVCQIAFEQMSSPAAVPYYRKPGSKYQGQVLPEESRLAMDVEFAAGNQ